MLAQSLVPEQLPGISQLVSDFYRDFRKVSPFYEFSPTNSGSYQKAAQAVRYPAERRERLVEALREQNPANPSLELLARPDCVVVATGQQVGLFLGPAYTIFKALTAARLARRLTERGIPAVPVFWMATEDHDFAEVNHCWVFDGEHRPVRLETGGDFTQRPVGTIPVSDDPAATLNAALAGFPAADQVLKWAAEAYSPGASLGDAFGLLLARVVQPYGVLRLDPLRPALRKLAAPLLGQALEGNARLIGLLLERNRQLEAAGYHAQVKVEEGGSLLFALQSGKRLPLRQRDGAFPTTLTAEALSANALLRPVIQDYMLPTVATVMGPGEIAYMAQSAVLYRELLDRFPVVVPRASFTLADARSVRWLQRYGLTLGALEAGEEAVREHIAERLVPTALAGSLEQASAATAERLGRLRDELAGFDRSLADAVDVSSRKILYQFGKIQRKVGREALRRDRRSRDEASRLCSLLYPRRQLQERFYSILPFLAQHGVELIERVYEAIDLDRPNHRLLEL